MRFQASILIVVALSAGAAYANQVTYDVPWAVASYPTQGSYSGCGPIQIEGLPARIVTATFNVTGTITPGITSCDGQPWGMDARVAMYFSGSGNVLQSATVTYLGEVEGSFELPINVPEEIGSGGIVLICFSLGPTPPVCGDGPWPTAIVDMATVTLEFDSPTPVESRTWGRIKALYR